MTGQGILHFIAGSLHPCATSIYDSLEVFCFRILKDPGQASRQVRLFIYPRELMPNQILKIFLKNIRILIKNFRSKKYFCRGQKYFLRSKISQRKINENRKLRFSKFSIFIDFPLDFFGKIRPRTKYFVLDKNIFSTGNF